MANEHVEHYSYRIEFQVRGLPHLHGVFWIKESTIEDYKKDSEFDEEEIGTLIDQWISCSLNTDNEDLNKRVREVNVHKHTKTCQRGSNLCRFSFPKLPSDKTLIAKPLSVEEEGRKKCEEKLSKALQILEKVKMHLSIMTNEVLTCLFKDFGSA